MLRHVVERGCAVGFWKTITYAGIGLSILSAAVDHGKNSPSAEAETAVAVLADVLGGKAPGGDGSDHPADGPPAQGGLAGLIQ